MLKKIRLKNFRAFEETEIDLSRINLFFGPNNSGKSAIISSINLIAQTLESADPSVPILFDGNRIDLGTYKDTVYKNDINKEIKLGFDYSIGDDEGYTSESLISFDLTLGYRKIKREIILKNIRLLSGTNEFVSTGIRKEDGQIGLKYSKNYLIGPSINRKLGPTPLRHFFPLPVGMLRQNFITMELGPEILRSLSREISIITNFFKGIEYIGPFREYPQRTFLFRGENPRTVGKFGENYVSILFKDSVSKKKFVMQQTSKWLKEARIAREVEMRVLTDRHFEIVLHHADTEEPENIADVGFGCSQIIPILVGGYNLSPGSMFIVEQPELHLHPRAQSELGNFFFNLHELGIQTIVETHSEHLLLRIQTLIAEKKLNPEDVRIYYVFANKEGKKEARLLRIDDHGYFIDEWPEGFFPEKLDEARKLAIAQLQGE